MTQAMALRALICALLLCSCPALAGESCEPAAEKSAQNPDGTTLSVATTCDDADTRTYLIQAKLADGSIDRMTVEASSDEAPTGGASLVDIDGDGYHEVEVRGMCGAGPNCQGELYRINRKRGEIELYFSGGYSDLSVIDGYLVEAGRASCCSWEYHAYRLDGREGVRDYANMDMMVEVGADLSSGEEDGTTRCRFSRRNGDAQEVIMPPSKKWLPLCELYGNDYHVVTPREARAAEAAADAQE
ncbi:MAG: hypothetical protein ABIP44_00965 [Pseudoxanthomonas sp.]